MRMLRRTATVALAAAGVMAVLTVPAQASDAPGMLCRTFQAAVVHSPNTGEPKYVIPADRDMRVHDISDDGFWFYGHGGPRNDDGWAHVGNFSYCR